MGKNDMPTLDVIRIKHYSLIQRCKSSEPSPASEQSCSSVCLGRHKWEEVGPLEARSQHEEVFTGLMTILPSPTSRYSFRLWVSRFTKPWHSSQAGACKSPWATWWASLLLPQMGALLRWLLPQLYLGQYCFYGPCDLWLCQLFNHSVGPPFSAVR